jgi:intracellular multiplication protein IcmL
LEERSVVKLRDEFYRDSIGKVVFIMLSMCIALAIVVCLSIFFYFNKPAPIIFEVNNDMRVVQSVPLNQPYLATPDVLQWVANVFTRSLMLDFNHYNDQLKNYSQYFTSDGWTAFLNQLNIYANYNNVQAYKLFITAKPSLAPIVLREGVSPDSGKYGWWVEFPVIINYAGLKPPPNVTITYQILVVRVPTLNNLTGIGIDNVIQAPVATGNQTQ